jgi:hypothetical protein
LIKISLESTHNIEEISRKVHVKCIAAGCFCIKQNKVPDLPFGHFSNYIQLFFYVVFRLVSEFEAYDWMGPKFSGYEWLGSELKNVIPISFSQ